MPGSPFKSFGNLTLVGKRPTADEMAIELACEQIEVIQEARAEAKARELACEPPLPTTEAHRQAYTTLDALLKGRHRHVVLPLLLETFPELLTPATLTAEEVERLQHPAGEA